MAIIKNELALILGNQLFDPKYFPFSKDIPIFMCESDDLCTHFKYHKLKIIFFLAAMRSYRDELKSHSFNCHYTELSPDSEHFFIDQLEKYCLKMEVKTLHFFEIEDHFFNDQIIQFCNKNTIKPVIYDSPMFLTKKIEFKTYLDSTKRPFMKTFYESQRKIFNILMDNGKPVGGKYSFDEENRKKTPKKIIFPKVDMSDKSSYIDPIKKLVQTKFPDHIGSDEICWFPVTRLDALDWLDTFISERFSTFGDFEDAIDFRSDFLFHSVISPLINCGLLTPQTILDKLKSLKQEIPLNSKEGFIRQIIGWREFIRGIYHNFDEKQQTDNFFNHQHRLTHHWYKGTTGIDPLDDAIKQVLSLGYTHHINRLMVIGNTMLLCRIHPQDVFKWFMECFIDSSDWVMGPNVFGMSQFSDGGIFATKPYFCGSNYIRKMSHYPKGDWCEIMDALYWRFIIDHQDFFSKNYRMKFMVSQAGKFSTEKIDTIIHLSDKFINKVTTKGI